MGCQKLRYVIFGRSLSKGYFWIIYWTIYLYEMFLDNQEKNSVLIIFEGILKNQIFKMGPNCATDILIILTLKFTHFCNST